MWGIAFGAAIVWASAFYVWRRKHRPVSVPAPETASTPPAEPSREPAPVPSQPTMVMMMTAPARVRRRFQTIRGLWNFAQDLVEWAVFAALIGLLAWVLGEIVLHRLFPGIDHNAIAQFLAREAQRETVWVGRITAKTTPTSTIKH